MEAEGVHALVSSCPSYVAPLLVVEPASLISEVDLVDAAAAAPLHPWDARGTQTLPRLNPQNANRGPVSPIQDSAS